MKENVAVHQEHMCKITFGGNWFLKEYWNSVIPTKCPITRKTASFLHFVELFIMELTDELRLRSIPFWRLDQDTVVEISKSFCYDSERETVLELDELFFQAVNSFSKTSPTTFTPSSSKTALSFFLHTSPSVILESRFLRQSSIKVTACKKRISLNFCFRWSPESGAWVGLH